MTDTLILEGGDDVEEAVEEIEEAVEEAVEEIEEAVEEAVEEIVEAIEDNQSWLVNSLSILQAQMQTLTEAVTTMAALLIQPPLQEPVMEPEAEAEGMIISETPAETLNIPLQDDPESEENPEPIVETEVRRIIKI